MLGLTVRDALGRFRGPAPVAAALRPINEVGLGYLRLGEPTPSLSGGESQRLRIASRLRSSQRGVLYVFDEPSTGLHPLDVATLVGVFDRLLDAGATIIVIDHDLDLLAVADYLIDMGPGGGPDGGHIVAPGTPRDVARDPASVTGPWLATTSHRRRPGDTRGRAYAGTQERGASGRGWTEIQRATDCTGSLRTRKAESRWLLLLRRAAAALPDAGCSRRRVHVRVAASAQPKLAVAKRALGVLSRPRDRMAACVIETVVIYR